MSNPQEIRHNGELIAIVVHPEEETEEVKFYTNPKNTLQIGVQNRHEGTVLSPHIHPDISITIRGVKELIYIVKGKVRVTFYGTDTEKQTSIIIETGDLLIQYSKGHGFEFLEETKFIEVKNGPYQKGKVIKKDTL